jgi:hypothetical protein
MFPGYTSMSFVLIYSSVQKLLGYMERRAGTFGYANFFGSLLEVIGLLWTAQTWHENAKISLNKGNLSGC